MNQIYTVILIAMSLQTNAQVWCPDGTIWGYNYSAGASLGCETRTYVGDTLIGAFTAQHIRSETIQYDFITDDIDTLYESTYTRTQDSVVFVWTNDGSSTLHWDTLYWFNAQVGDHWLPPGVFDECGETGNRIEVIDIQNQLFGTVLLRAFSLVQYQEDGTVGVPFEMIERIGTPLMLLPTECPIGELISSVRSYTDNTGASFDSGVPSTCDSFTGLAETTSSGKMWISSDPASQLVRIHLKDPGVPHALEVFELTGRTISSGVLIGSTQVIDTSSWVSGVYIFNALLPNGERFLTKWVKT